MPAAVKEVTLQPTLEPADESKALAHAPETDISQFLDLAKSGVAVENIERLMALWERNQARLAETAYNGAMNAAQKQMRPVAVDAYNPSTKSKYASYEALDLALRPVYTEHGFSISYDTADSPFPEHVRVLCKVRHVAGHTEPHHVDMPADGKGAKGGDVMTKTHATGSAFTYAQRYLLKLIFNIAVGEGDDDGNRAGKLKGEGAPPLPPGYEDWWITLEAAAAKGMNSLDEAWGKSKGDYKNYVAKHQRTHFEQLKERAKAVRA